MIASAAQARQLSPAALAWHRRDVAETLELWRDAPAADPYVARLLAEQDLLVAEDTRRDREGR